ncbi:unnamed protein product [Owenia fusiformis]|uniref:Lysosomal Pro-X carboxypeptidase n=1 Tax=Owenia fusiformis TaxID=6347 RepID=A0A8S4NWF9_OWEFU|nr:unnamed protein product [Owenia fusiformis]
MESLKAPFTNILIIFTLCGSVFISMQTEATNTGLNERIRKFPMSTKTFESGYNYKTHYFETKVDHFGYANKDTFQLRYLVNDDHWDERSGPIFFYTGNEGDIDWFCNNTGFMWEIAPEYKAKIVFAEHRYYGKSLPYGQKSYQDPEHLGYLTSEQALADFAELLHYMRFKKDGARNNPVIAFGGSYGGMLAAWIRMKYPALVDGALAASAPIWQFTGITSCGVFDEIVTRDFTKTGEYCSQNIKNSWSVIDQIGSTQPGREQISNTFHLCKKLSSVGDVNSFKAWLSETWVNLAMVDYPYAASFLAPLPAWPVKVTCSNLNEKITSDRILLQQLYKAVGVYYNYTGQAQCLDTTSQGSKSLGDYGWDWQACTEMVMPMCSTGVSDMFQPGDWDIKAYSEGCVKQWGRGPKPYWIETQYGGVNINSSSNIIFSNGDLDPWSGGGYIRLGSTISSDLVLTSAVYIQINTMPKKKSKNEKVLENEGRPTGLTFADYITVKVPKSKPKPDNAQSKNTTDVPKDETVTLTCEAPIKEEASAAIAPSSATLAGFTDAQPKDSVQEPIYQVKRTKKGHIPISVEKRNKGKKVTVISNVSGNLPILLSELKHATGSGGVIRDNTVEIQGDRLDFIEKYLRKQKCLKQ